MQTPMNTHELTAVEGLLGLCSYYPYQQNSSQVSLHSQASSFSARLNPINANNANDRLPSIAQVLASPNTAYASSPYMSSSSSSSSSSTCSLNYILASPMCPSMSSSSSSASSISSSFSEHGPQQATRRTLRRATACILNRRGRPKKTVHHDNVMINNNSNFNNVKKVNEFKIIQCEYEQPTTAMPKPIRDNAPVTANKPRWQEAERISLIQAIVQEKQLDDMTTIQWDKVSKVVGRAKKACKDQWRREILPHLLKGFVRQDYRSRSTNDAEETVIDTTIAE